MAEERTYTIPLRKEFIKKPNYKRSKKAITAIKNFMIRHMKGSSVKIGPHLNTAIWKRGNKNPPAKIKVRAVKDDKRIVWVELPEFKFEAVEEKKEKKKTKTEEKTIEEKKDVVDLSLEKNIKKAAKDQRKITAEKETSEEEKS
ncbi:MAG: 50S ribosomal protein L31e [Nanoarchaeota archaeon]